MSITYTPARPMSCICGHQVWHHGTVTYPTHRRPCSMCVACNRCACVCWQGPTACRCDDFQKEPTP